MVKCFLFKAGVLFKVILRKVLFMHLQFDIQQNNGVETVDLKQCSAQFLLKLQARSKIPKVCITIILHPLISRTLPLVQLNILELATQWRIHKVMPSFTFYIQAANLLFKVIRMRQKFHSPPVPSEGSLSETYRILLYCSLM